MKKLFALDKIDLSPNPVVFIFICLMMIPRNVHAQVIYLTDTVIAPHEKIKLTCDSFPGNALDYIALASKAQAPESYLGYYFLNSQKKGSLEFDGQVYGEYELRGFFNNQPIVKTITRFRIGNKDQTPKINPDKPVFLPTEKISISFSGFPGNQTDWISIAKHGSAAGSYDQYIYLQKKQSGTLLFDARSFGVYELRGFFNNEYDIRTTAQLIIGDQNLTITPDKLSFDVGEPVSLKYAGFPGNERDWISISKPESGPGEYHSFQYLNKQKSGILVFNNVPDGEYELRGYVNNENVIRVKSAIKVGIGNGAVQNQSPGDINIQGVLTNATGQAVVDGTYSISFKLYDGLLSDSVRWEEKVGNINVVSGVFSTILGKTKPFNINFDKPYYLGIQVGAEPELKPRIELTSTPYSLMAKNVENNSISTDKIQSNAVTIDKIAAPIVSSINGMTNDGGNIKIVAGANITIVNDDQTKTMTISAVNPGGGSSGISRINPGNAINVTSQDGPTTTISVAPNSIGNNELQPNALTVDKIVPNVVSSISGVTNDGGNINLIAGTNINLVADNINKSITISAVNGTGGTGNISQLNEGNGISIQNPTGPFPTIGLKPNILLGPNGSLGVLNQNSALVGSLSANTNQGGFLNLSNIDLTSTIGMIGSNIDRQPLLFLNSRFGRQVAELKANEFSDGQLTLNSVLNNRTVQLTAANDAGGLINVFNSSGLITSQLTNSTAGDGISAGNGKLILNSAVNNRVLELQTNTTGGGRLSLFNVEGTEALRLSTINTYGGSISLRNRSGLAVARLIAQTDGDGELGIRNDQDKEVLYLSASEGKTGFIRVNDATESEVVKITAAKVGGGFIGISNRLGNEVAELLANEFSDGEIELYSVLKNPTLQFKANENAGGLINVFNPNGEVAARLMGDGSGFMGIFNREKTEMIQLGILDNQNARITVNNRLGNPAAEILSNTFSDGEIILSSVLKNPTMRLAANENAGGLLNVFSQTGIAASLTEIEGDGNLKIFNRDSQDIVTLQSINGDGSVDLRNKNGILSTFLSASPNGGAIHVNDGVKDANTRGVLQGNEFGGNLALYNAKKLDPVHEMGIDLSTQEGFLRINSKNESIFTRIDMGGDKLGNGYLNLYNTKGLNTFFVGHNEFNDGQIYLKNNLGNLGGFFTAFKDGGILAVTDGKPGTNHRATIGVGLFGGRTTIFNNSNLLTHESTVQNTGEGITRIVNPNDITNSRVELGGTALKDGFISTFDTKNKRNIDLRANSEGAGIITTYKNDKIQTTLNATTTGGDIEVFNAAGINTSVIGHLDDGRGKIEVGHSNGIKVVRMTSNTDGSGYIGVDNVDKNEVVRLTANTGKGGGIGVKNNLNKDIVTITQSLNSNGSILVNNASGNNTSAMAHFDDGRGKIEVGTADGTKVARMTANTDGSGFISVDNVDKLDVVRITANTGKGGGIALRNDKGFDMIKLTQDQSYGTILVNNAAGGLLTNITRNTANGGFIGTKDQNGKDAIWLNTGTAGGGYLNTFNSLGKAATTLSSDASNNGNISVHGSAGNEIARINGSSGGTGLVSIFNGSGTNLAGLSFNSLSGGGYVFAQNSSGKELARMTTTNDGATGRISIDNSTGINLAGLTASSLGTGYIFANATNGKNVAIMTTTSGGGGFISATNPAATSVSYLASNNSSGGYVGVANSAGNDRARITTNTGGSGIMSVSNSAGNDVVEASVSTQNHGTVATYNATGQFMGGILATTSGHGYLTAYNSTGNERAHMSSGSNGGEISLHDNGGSQRMYLNGSGSLEIDDVDGASLRTYFTGTGVGFVSVDKLTHPRAEFKPGHINVNGTNGGENAFMGAVSGSPHLGYIGVCNGNIPGSPVKAGLYTNNSNQGVIFADVKNFRMDYPGKPDQEIWYGSLEGPELAAYIRGTGKLINGKATIEFPDHYIEVANAKTMTVILTPLSGKSKGLAVVNKKALGFEVEELMEGSGEYEFDWEVKCVRKGYEHFEAVRNKSDQPKQFVQDNNILNSLKPRGADKTDVDPIVKEKIVRQQ